MEAQHKSAYDQARAILAGLKADEELLDDKVLSTLKQHFLSFMCFNLVPSEGLAREVTRLRLVEEFALVRGVFERALLSAISQESHVLFDRAQREVLAIYFDEFVLNNLPLSYRQGLVVAAILLRHLAGDNLEQFHLTIRRMSGRRRAADNRPSFFGLPLDDLSERDRAFLDYPISLERDIMDGNISRVMAKVNQNIQNKYFEWFSKQLSHTLRRRMAVSIEAAYSRIPMEKLRTLLGFTDETSLLHFVENIRLEKDNYIASLNVHKSTQAQDVFSAKWVCPDTPSELSASAANAERPSTPSLMGSKSSELLASASRGAKTTSRTFLLTKQNSEGFDASTNSELIERHHQPELLRANLVGRFHYDAQIGQTSTSDQCHGNHLWLLSSDKKHITFKQISKPKPLIPAHDLMRQWLGYASDLEGCL